MRHLVLVGLVACVAAPASALAQDPPDPGKTKSLVYGSGAEAWPYIVYVPSSYERAHPAPLVVFAHGCQTTAEEQMRSSLYNQVAEREGFIVLYADVSAEKAAWPGPLAHCWQIFDPNSAHRDRPDPAAIAGMTQAVIDRWRIDSQRVYMLGISAGGIMAATEAAAYPELFAAVAISASSAYSDSVCFATGTGIPAATSAELAYAEMGPRARIVPRLVFGGDADQAFPPSCTAKSLEQGLRTNNLVIGGTQDGPISLTPASTREQSNPGGYSSTVSSYRDPSGCLIAERWLIHGMGHYWPGGSADPQWDNWTDPMGPSGAELSWRFFERYAKDATAMPCAEAPKRRERCRARWVTLRVPARARAKTVRARANGLRASVLVADGRARVRLPATRRARTKVVVRGRTAAGKRFTRRHTYRGCGR